MQTHPLPAVRRQFRFGLFRTFLLSCLLIPLAFAQSTGSISGRVQNADAGLYLNNARVTIEGTTREVFTDAFGEYRIGGVPSGSVTLRVFYTGLAPQTAAVSVAPGGTAQQDFFLSGSATKAVGDGTVAVLDKYVIEAARETNASAIAINEQRFAANMKTVVSTDSLGDIAQNNIGEFAKHLPGVDIETDQMNTVAIKLRGLPSSFTNIAIDGADVSAAGTGALDRGSQFHAISLNNTARIEIMKVPTPDMSAASLGGAINLVSRNSFERRKAELKFRTYVNMNSHDFGFSKKPGGAGGDGDDQKSTYKYQPDFDFTYVVPVSSNFGISINGLKNDQFMIARRINRAFAVSGTAGATLANPSLSMYQTNLFPVYEHRYSGGIRFDWKLSPVDVVTLSYTGNYLYQDYEQHIFDVRPGPNPVSWGPDFVHGRPGAGQVVLNLATQYASTRNNVVRFNYRHTGKDWDITSALGFNRSKFWYRTLGYRQLGGTSAQLLNVGIDMDGFSDYLPGRITVRNASGAVVDPFALENYRYVSGNTGFRDNEGNGWSGQVDAKRKFTLGNTNGSLKAGLASNEVTKTRHQPTVGIAYLGADGRANSGDEGFNRIPGNLLNEALLYYSQPRGFNKVEFPSARKAYELYEAHPEYFDLESSRAANIRSSVTTDEKIVERVDAVYLMSDLSLLRNRLRVVAGVRYERTTDDGWTVLQDDSAQYQRDAAGNVILANGRPVPIYSGTLTVDQQIARDALIYTRRGLHTHRTYGDYYPSLNASFNITENLIARLGAAKTVGRPNFGNIVGTAIVTQTDFTNPDVTGAALGTIRTKNPLLKPWTGHGLDLRLEYYTDNGGDVSIGAFRKEIKDFFSNQNFLATPEFLNSLGLSDEYVDFQVIAPGNVDGIVHINGLEFSVDQPLHFIPRVGRYFRARANVTSVHTEGPAEADFRGFTPLNVNWSFSFSRKPVSFTAKWNYISRKRIATAAAGNYGGTAWTYQGERLRCDVSLDYWLTRHFSAFVSARNVFNDRDQNFTFAEGSPEYVKFNSEGEYGSLIQFGIKGTF